MKVLKKYFKVVLCFMAFALCSFMFAFTPSISAAMAVNYTIAEYKTAINALKIKDVVDYSKTGEQFTVPLLSNVLGNTATLGDSTEDYTIRVIDPAGYAHDYVVDGTENDTTYFTGLDSDKKNLIVNAKNDGVYKVVYIVATGTGEAKRTFYSNTYKVTVKNVSYELDFTYPVYDTEDVDGDDNTTEILGYETKLIKSRLQKSSTPYEIPVAYAKQVDGDTTTIPATIKVTKNGAPQKLNDSGSIFTSTTANSATKYFITPSETGVYTIEYSYEKSVNRPTKTFTVNVVENFEASELTLASKDPTFKNFALGKKGIELPELTFNSETEKNVNFNVKSIVIEHEDNSDIKCVLRNNTLTFDMTTTAFGATSYADMVGNYIVTYNVEDAYGKKATEQFVVNGVTVTTNPTIALSYDYDTSKADYKETVKLGAETELKAEYVLADNNSTIILPAVYVDDAVTTDFSKFTIIRSIRKGSTYYYVDNIDSNGKTIASDNVGYNASGDENIGDPTKAVKFKFSENAENIEGTYYIEYKVISNEVKSNRNAILYKEGTQDRYSFKIVPSHAKTTPTITIENLTDSSVKATDAVSFNIKASDDMDTRLLNTAFIYTGVKAGNTENITQNVTTAIGSADRMYNRTKSIFEVDAFTTEMNKLLEGFKQIAVNEETGNYDLDLTGYTGKVYVVAATVNDDGIVDTDVKELTIKDTTNDVTAPTFEINTDDTTLDAKWLTETSAGSGVYQITEFTVGQGVDIKLPTVFVRDAADNELTMNVTYYIDSPENSFGAIDFKSPVGKDFDKFYEGLNNEDVVQVIKGGTITTSATGVYYVAYSAMDAAGNVNVMYLTFVVEDTSKPILNVNPTGEKISQTGNTIEAEKDAVIDFKTTLTSADGKNDYTNDKIKTNIKLSVDTNGIGLNWYKSDGKILFEDYGTYVVTVTGSYDGRTADEKVIRVVITDEITWVDEFDVPEYASKDSEVYLPMIRALNADFVDVTVTAPGGLTPTEGDVEEKNVDGMTYFVFKTNKESKGNYTVTYTAKNNEGQTLTKTFKIKVGDNVAPTMEYDKGDLTQNLVYNDKDIELVITVDKTSSNKKFVVKIINDGKEYVKDINLKISDKDDTNTINSDYPWTDLDYNLTGANFTKGEETATSKQYFIKGVGSYSIVITVKDSYENETKETIDFKVVTKSDVEEKNDVVVGVVLIIMSLILLAGVILFFTFTGKKGGKKAKKEKVSKQPKEVKKVEDKKVEVVETEKVEEPKVETVQETKTEEVEETTNTVEEPKAEETAEVIENEEKEVVEENNNDEPKEGEVE